MPTPTTGTITGNTTAITYTLLSSTGNEVVVVCDGTFSGVTVKVELQSVESPATWLDISDGGYVANFANVFTLWEGAKIRLNVTGAGSPVPSINYSIA